MESERRLIALDAFRPFLRILHIYDLDNFRQSDQRIVNRNICRAIVFTTLLSFFVLGVLGYAWYCIRLSFDLSEVAMPLGLLINSGQVAITYFFFTLKIHRVDEVFGILNGAISKRRNLSERASVGYGSLEKQFELLARVAIGTCASLSIGLYIQLASLPILYWFLGFPEPHQWGLSPGLISQLSEMNPFVEFYIDWVMQVPACALYYTMVLTAALFFIGMCWYVREMVSDLQKSLEEFGDAISVGDIIGLVGFHREILKLVCLVGEIMSAGLFFQLLVCALSVALYMVGLAESGLLTMNFAIMLVGLTTNLISTYIYCLFAENVTNDVATIADAFYQSRWYQMPVKQQKLFIAPIQCGQMECRMTGLGLVECSLRVFSSIIRAAWSYFLFMHQSN